MNGMNPPFQKRQTFPRCVPRGESTQGWKCAFTSAVNVGQFKNYPIWRALKIAEDLGGANMERDRLAPQKTN